MLHPSHTTLRGLLLFLLRLVRPSRLPALLPTCLISSTLLFPPGLDELAIETQHLPTMVEAMGLEADRPPSEELPAPRPPPLLGGSGISGDAVHAEQQQQHTSKGRCLPVLPQLTECRGGGSSGSRSSSLTACATDEQQQGLEQPPRPPAPPPPGCDVVSVSRNSREGNAAADAATTTTEWQLLPGRVSALSICQQGGCDDGGAARLIRFAQNAGGSRRYLVSRSGHVFVASGLTVVCMVTPSISSFLQRLLT